MFNLLRQNIRPLLMVAAMITGVTLYHPISIVDGYTGFRIAPIMIFSMLFVTFCRVHIRELKFSYMHIILVLFQVIATPLVYYAFLPFGDLIAQGVMVCFLAPIAMGAVAIGALLGANISTLASYTLVCNLVIAFVAPYYLDIFGNGECTLPQILSRVAPLLLSPLFFAQLLKFVWSRGANFIASHGQLSFYMWLLSMIVTLARTTDFILDVVDDSLLQTAILLALVSLLACVSQYLIGRFIGKRCGDPIAGAQSLGQKNTVLAVWLAQTFLFPVSCIAPTAYIIWQNMVNSFQIYLHDKRCRKL